MSYLGPVSSNQDGTIINYIPYGTIENNTTRGWSACTLTWSGNAPSGAPTLTATQMAISASSVSPLSSLYSLLLTKSAANAQYQGFVSDAFTIKREDLAKVLTGSFYYEVASGTVDMSGSSTQSLEIWVYNVNANQWIQPAGYRGLNQSSGPGLVSFTFQTDSTAANNSYRIAVITQQTSATAYTVKFDNFKLSPQTAPIGPVMSDWISYTPTITHGSGSMTNATASGRYRRVGDSIEVYGTITFSAASAAFAEIFASLPAGLTFDTTKFSSTGSLVPVLGTAFCFDTGFTVYGAGNVLYRTSTAVDIRYPITTVGANPISVATNVISNVNPFIFNTGDTISWHYMAPISGWSSQVQLSNDTDTRVVAMAIYSGTTQSIASQGAEGSEPIFTAWPTTATVDTHSGWLGGGQYRIPVSGQYLVNAKINKAGATANSFAMIVKVYKNGTALSNRFSRYDQPAISQAQLPLVGSEIYTLNAGDVIDLRIFQNSGSALLFGSESTALVIQRLSGPSVIAATENVIAKYSTTAGQAITSTPATVVYATREIDSHGIVNTINGDITIPISGKYLIGVYGSTASATWASGQQFLWQIRKNGSFSSFINQIRAQAAYTGILESVGPTYIDCLAGDVINIQAQSSVATTLRTAAGTNFFYLVRLGN